MRGRPCTRGTRDIMAYEKLGPRAWRWLLRCGHRLEVTQRPRDGQVSAVCEICRGAPVDRARSRGKWKTSGKESADG